MNIEEIKAREQAATPGPWIFEKSQGGYVHNHHITVLYGQADNDEEDAKIVMKPQDLEFACHARTDIPALIAEVERLTKENEQNANYAEIYQYICDKYGKNFRALLDKAKAFQAENAILKKAYELLATAYGKYYNPYSTLEERARLLPQHMDYFMKQAQQLTHKTHGESEANHATNN
jgi:hypothetical protein